MRLGSISIMSCVIRVQQGRGIQSGSEKYYNTGRMMIRNKAMMEKLKQERIY